MVSAHFYSIDPETGWTPPVDIGFLPPEDGTRRGMGYVSYIIDHKEDLEENSQIRNIALIIFDMGENIYTNQVDPHDPSQGTDPEKEALVTIDKERPSSSVSPLAEISDGVFVVSWGGSDSASGIAAYDIYTRDGQELKWFLWKERISDTSAEFIGTPSHTHEFYSIAIDNVGHREQKAPVPDAKTYVQDDPDNDGVLGSNDNCPFTANSDQLDTDGDSEGNACDDDDDNDGRQDQMDNCPVVVNTDQVNTDGDALGNACDEDDDNDDVLDQADNCPVTANGDQLDTDGDSLGDACDADDDNDQVGDANDNCPLTVNADQLNADGDSAGDACDLCPLDADNDIDGDGICGNADNCPAEQNSDQNDLDQDGLGDLCDPQTCGNGILETIEKCDDSNSIDGDGCSAQCIPETIISITKAEVEWDDGEIKYKGEIVLPLEVPLYDVVPQGAVFIGLADLGQVVAETVVFTIKGSENTKWEYKDGVGSITKFKIDWKGASFDYKGLLHLKANHIGQDSTSLEIERNGLSGAFSIQIGAVSIQVDTDNVVVTAPETLEVDADDADGEIEVDLPFALTPEMTIIISRPDLVDTAIPIADYYTNSVGKFDLTASFEAIDLTGLDRPTYLKLGISLGEVGYPGSNEISSGWKSIKSKEWKYKND
ncbi:MAG: thrombospondin type 3 repeat-containing protein [Proteobacteria bacterium]|nr:thrombospondin type 3 repeat-containing protein [Pseudomonadota bacterium]